MRASATCVTVFLAAVCGVESVTAAEAVSKPVRYAGTMEIVVHRGANHLAPENTAASARKAVELGCQYVEVDVRTSADGVMYVIHDPNVARTTDGEGFIRKMTSEQIDMLDAGSWFLDLIKYQIKLFFVICISVYHMQRSELICPSRPCSPYTHYFDQAPGTFYLHRSQPLTCWPSYLLQAGQPSAC